MAIPVASNLDLMQNELHNVRLQQLASAPPSPVTGQVYYNTASKRAFIWDGSSWNGMDGIGATMTGADIVAAINAQAAKIGLGKIDVGVFTPSNDGLAPKATDTTKYLKGDGTWASPPNTTYTKFSTSADGLVPKASVAGDTGKYLKGDGSWATPPDTKVPVVDNLNSTSGTSALSANQGKVLDGKITTAQSAAESAAKDYADGLIQTLVGSAPTVLDTLEELADALGSDPNFAATMTSALASKTEKFTQNIGNNSATSFDITHNLNSRAVTVQVYQNASPWAMILCDVELTTVNKVKLTFAKAPTSNEYSVVIVG